MAELWFFLLLAARSVQMVGPFPSEAECIVVKQAVQEQLKDWPFDNGKVKSCFEAKRYRR